MSACNCCERPPCGDPLIVMDIVSFGFTKCGVSFGEDTPESVDEVWPVWKKITSGYSVRQYSINEDGECVFEDSCIEHVRTQIHECTADLGYMHGDYSTTIVTTTGADCVDSVTYSGSSSFTVTGVGQPPCACTSTQNADGTWTGTATGPNPPCVTGGVTSPCWEFCDSVGTITESDTTTPDGVFPEAHEEEFTTADLISYVEAHVPAYDGIFDSYAIVGGLGASASFRNLGLWQQSYHITRVKWGVQHQATGSCYLKVWFEIRFVAEGVVDGSYTVLASPTYERLPTDTPCLPDPSTTFLDSVNTITSDLTELLEPEEDGQVYIAMLKFSCLAEYEPDISDPENPQPNGFPDPTWTPAP